MLQVRWLEETDYEMLVKWWKDNRFTPPPRAILPDRGKCGIMVSDEKNSICAGFIYFTNSGLAWIEYIVANFEIKEREKRKKALNLLIQSLVGIIEKEGFVGVFTSCKSQGLMKRFLDSGFQIGSTGTTELIKIL